MIKRINLAVWMRNGCADLCTAIFKDDDVFAVRQLLQGSGSFSPQVDYVCRAVYTDGRKCGVVVR
jgi:hypothetical protein